jgi:hypothetical protein
MDIIEMLEKNAVDVLAEKDLIPRQGNWEVLESWGISKKESSDPLFYEAVLPPGWSKVRDKENDRLIYLVDQKGEPKAAIFYKSGAYDRKAGITIL